MIQLKSLVGPMEYIWTSDPAIDKEHSAYDEAAYLKTWDQKYMPCKEGQTLTKFTLARLTRKQRMAVDHLVMKGREVESFCEAAAYGIKGIQGWEIDGRPIEVKLEDGELGQRLTGKTLDLIYDTSLMIELGGRVQALSALDPTSGRGL